MIIDKLTNSICYNLFSKNTIGLGLNRTFCLLPIDIRNIVGDLNVKPLTLRRNSRYNYFVWHGRVFEDISYRYAIIDTVYIDRQWYTGTEPNFKLLLKSIRTQIIGSYTIFIVRQIRFILYPQKRKIIPILKTHLAFNFFPTSQPHTRDSYFSLNFLLV